ARLSERHHRSIFRLSADLFALNNQVLQVEYSKTVENGAVGGRRRFLATLSYGLGQNLFHICADQPSGARLIGIGDLSIESRLGKRTRAGLLNECRHGPK